MYSLFHLKSRDEDQPLSREWYRSQTVVYGFRHRGVEYKIQAMKSKPSGRLGFVLVTQNGDWMHIPVTMARRWTFEVVDDMMIFYENDLVYVIPVDAFIDGVAKGSLMRKHLRTKPIRLLLYDDVGTMEERHIAIYHTARRRAINFTPMTYHLVRNKTTDCFVVPSLTTTPFSRKAAPTPGTTPSDPCAALRPFKSFKFPGKVAVRGVVDRNMSLLTVEETHVVYDGLSSKFALLNVHTRQGTTYTNLSVGLRLGHRGMKDIIVTRESLKEGHEFMEFEDILKDLQPLLRQPQYITGSVVPLKYDFSYSALMSSWGAAPKSLKHRHHRSIPDDQVKRYLSAMVWFALRRSPSVVSIGFIVSTTSPGSLFEISLPARYSVSRTYNEHEMLWFGIPTECDFVGRRQSLSQHFHKHMKAITVEGPLRLYMSNWSFSFPNVQWGRWVNTGSACVHEDYKADQFDDDDDENVEWDAVSYYTRVVDACCNSVNISEDVASDVLGYLTNHPNKGLYTTTLMKDANRARTCVVCLTPSDVRVVSDLTWDMNPLEHVFESSSVIETPVYDHTWKTTSRACRLGNCRRVILCFVRGARLVGIKSLSE